MKISLTKELKDYLASQMQTGYYASTSEVIREALRNQIHSSTPKQVDSGSTLLSYQRVRENSET